LFRVFPLWLIILRAEFWASITEGHAGKFFFDLLALVWVAGLSQPTSQGTEPLFSSFSRLADLLFSSNHAAILY
jgi:hypothetical protein